MATELDKAEQQLYGWYCEMALTDKEWEELKDGEAVNYLTDCNRSEIDEHFIKEKSK